MPHTKIVFDSLEKDVPFLKTLGIRSMLYIGWRWDTRSWWYEFGRSLGARHITVLEAHGQNVVDLKREVATGKYDLQVRHGDVRDFNLIFPHDGFGENAKTFDLIFWDHGPEHVTLAELENVTSVLSDNVGKILLYVAPWGKWPQGPDESNKLEEHKIDLVPKHLEDMGMVVSTFGGPDQIREGELVAYLVKP